MTEREKIARGFGAVLASTPGPEAQEERLEAQRAAFAEAVALRASEGRRVRFGPLVGAAAAAGLAAAVLVAYFALGRSADTIVFFVGDSSVAAEEGCFVRTGPDQKETVRFDGGHRFEFGAQTAGRVAEAGDGRVTVDMTEGEVSASIVPGSNIAWTVRAGPYAVMVKGTIFQVRWEDAMSRLFVTVERGKVAVSGPGIDDEGVYLSAGKSLRAESGIGRVVVEDRATATVPPSVPDAVPSVEIGDDATEEVSPSMTDGSETDGRSPQVPRRVAAAASWRELYERGEFATITESAFRKGVEGLKRRLGREDLWAVANAARYQRNREMADTFFAAYRERFPRTAQAKTAAFLLGKSALAAKRFPSARQWFEAYLTEAPSGPLAEEALGRLIQINRRMGDVDGARRAAEAYLARFEGGHFSKQARIALQ